MGAKEPGAHGGAVACKTLLGEGGRWDSAQGELLRVDILAGNDKVREEES